MRQEERRKPWRAEILIVAALTIAIAVIGWVKVSGLIDDVQQNRVEFITQECLDVNQRHDNTVDALNALLDKALEKHPERASQIEQSRESTILLIDALVPVRDCEERVKELKLAE